MTVRFNLYRYFREFEVSASYQLQSIAGYNDFGDPIKTTEPPVSFKMNVQPFTPEELKQMPAGAELENTLKFYTPTIIPIDDASENITNVLIKGYKGKDYRIVSRKTWENSDHIKYLCVEDRFDVA